MLKIARKTHNFAIFHLFLVYFFPQTGPRPIFSPPLCRTYFEVYTSLPRTNIVWKNVARTNVTQTDVAWTNVAWTNVAWTNVIWTNVT